MVLPPGTLLLWGLTLGTAVAQSLWGWGRVAQAFGVGSAHLSCSALLGAGAGRWVPGWLTLVTYVFPHRGWWHVLSNMLALWLFGAMAERRLGTWRFVAGYFLSGVVGAFEFAWVVPQAAQPLAGASLAIAGLAGGYTAWRWSNQSHSGAQRLMVFGLEVVAVAGVIAALALRRVPAAPDRLSSVLYHVLPLLTQWLGMRAYTGCRSRYRSFRNAAVV